MGRVKEDEGAAECMIGEGGGGDGQEEEDEEEEEEEGGRRGRERTWTRCRGQWEPAPALP